VQVKTLLNRVQKVKGFVYGKVAFEGDGIAVAVRPRRGSRPYCAGCGQRGPAYDRLPPRPWPNLTRPVTPNRCNRSRQIAAVRVLLCRGMLQLLDNGQPS